MPTILHLGTHLTSWTLWKPCELVLLSPGSHNPRYTYLFLESDPVYSFPGKISIILYLSSVSCILWSTQALHC